ncbi:cellulase family glycosylhydrolase [Nannocystis radixulma]|uniref:Cellulase family glycosylhydrolase n=1 Tax=Nannocystis radixulma TaxID=2995305 RepID=A0ABT5B3B4_9BACT|nr:cellulase family glycosylhydrolase [Nannocystis radixulma]MDC0668599.1 cellulase family glycosylhydrolase [Nannocystis radixulma]
MRRALVLWAAVIGCGGTPPASSSATETTTGGATTDTPTSTGATGTTTAAPTTGETLAPGECASPIEPVLLTSARVSLDAAGRMHDELGRDVLLRGVNTGGRSKWAPFVPFPIDAEIEQAAFAAAAEQFFARLPPWGINVVRLLFSWEALEPTPGQYDARYLDRYAAMVDAAWSHGLRVVVDFHQDIYTSTYCGDGFPPWTLPQDPPPQQHECPDADWGLKYVFDGDVQAAFDRFWADEDGLQAQFLAMWGQMIARVGDHPGVVGLEILNEPGSGTATDIAAWKQDTLNPFHSKVIAALREQAGEELLILFDNPGVDAVGLQPVEHVRPEGEGIVYAAHMYDAGLVKGMPSIGMMPEPYLDQVAEFAEEEGLGVLIGEYGVVAGTAGGPEWLRRALDHMDARRLSSTLWECSQNEVLWNEEDLSVLGADGSERAELDVFVRPYLRAVAGTDSAFAWAEPTATASWTGDGGVSEIALPPRRFADAALDIELTTLAGPEGACWTLDPSRGELRVQAPAGAQVEVRVTVDE